MANADVRSGHFLPEVGPGDILMPEPDRLVVLMADRIGVSKPGQERAGGSYDRE